MASRNYKYYQPNEKDLKDNYGDCVIRALTKVMSKTWTQVFDDLIPYAKRLQCMPNGKQCYESYLKENGFTYHGISNKKGSKRPTVDRFAKEHKSGTFFSECCKSLRGSCGWILLRYMGFRILLLIRLLGKRISRNGQK